MVKGSFKNQCQTVRKKNCFQPQKLEKNLLAQNNSILKFQDFFMDFPRRFLVFLRNCAAKILGLSRNSNKVQGFSRTSVENNTQNNPWMLHSLSRKRPHDLLFRLYQLPDESTNFGSISFK